MSMTTFIFAFLLLLATLGTTLLVAYGKFKRREFMSFREAIGLADLPIVTFYQGDKKLNFLLDTGANLSVINSKVINNIDVTISEVISSTMGIEGNKINNITNVDIVFTYKNKEFLDTFQVIDMEEVFNQIKRECGVTIHGIIGNKFMQRYKYILDFDDMIAYSKK